jgi:hypothetical protein
MVLTAWVCLCSVQADFTVREDANPPSRRFKLQRCVDVLHIATSADGSVQHGSMQALIRFCVAPLPAMIIG